MKYGVERLAEAKFDGVTCPYCRQARLVNADDYYGIYLRAVRCHSCGYMDFTMEQSKTRPIEDEGKGRGFRVIQKNANHDGPRYIPCPFCDTGKMDGFYNTSGACSTCMSKLKSWAKGKKSTKAPIPVILLREPYRTEYMGMI
jgi:uncharacterized protein (DUF983 family)